MVSKDVSLNAAKAGLAKAAKDKEAAVWVSPYVAVKEVMVSIIEEDLCEDRSEYGEDDLQSAYPHIDSVYVSDLHTLIHAYMLFKGTDDQFMTCFGLKV